MLLLMSLFNEKRYKFHLYITEGINWFQVKRACWYTRSSIGL